MDRHYCYSGNYIMYNIRVSTCHKAKLHFNNILKANIKKIFSFYWEVNPVLVKRCAKIKCHPNIFISR